MTFFRDFFSCDFFFPTFTNYIRPVSVDLITKQADMSRDDYIDNDFYSVYVKFINVFSYKCHTCILLGKALQKKRYKDTPKRYRRNATKTPQSLPEGFRYTNGVLVQTTQSRSKWRGLINRGAALLIKKS